MLPYLYCNVSLVPQTYLVRLNELTHKLVIYNYSVNLVYAKLPDLINSFRDIPAEKICRIRKFPSQKQLFLRLFSFTIKRLIIMGNSFFKDCSKSMYHIPPFVI